MTVRRLDVFRIGRSCIMQSHQLKEHTMKANDYHALPRASSTGLKYLLQNTPAHYYARFVDPEREQVEPSPAMKLGSAWHKIIFEYDDFASEYVVVPEGIDRRSKEGKALFAEIESSGREPLSFNDFSTIAKMRESALKNSGVSHLLSLDGESEKSFMWIDQRTGLKCKARMDRIVYPCAEYPHGAVIDGKSCQSASIEFFGRDVWNMGYCIQAAFYVDAFQIEFQTDEPPEFVWIAQEKSAPYLPALRRARQDHIEYGREQYRLALGILKECQDTGIYPGYGDNVVDQELPAWAQKQIDNSDESIEVSYVE